MLFTLSTGNSHASEAGSKAFVNDLVTTVLDVVKSDTAAESKMKSLNALFLKSVDTDWIGKFVLGKYWRTATKAQQDAYLEHYGGFLTKTYTKRFTEYSNEKVNISQVTTIGKDEYDAKLELISSDGPPVVMHFKMRKKSGAYKVFDILVEGVSLITTQRSEFGAVVERKGLDYLISVLKKRAAS